MLLQRCLKGLTQNQNDLSNNMLWSICSKRMLCDYRNLFCVNETRTKLPGSCYEEHWLCTKKRHIDFSERKISDKPGSHDKNNGLIGKGRKLKIVHTYLEDLVYHQSQILS